MIVREKEITWRTTASRDQAQKKDTSALRMLRFQAFSSIGLQVHGLGFWMRNKNDRFPVTDLPPQPRQYELGRFRRPTPFPRANALTGSGARGLVCRCI